MRDSLEKMILIIVKRIIHEHHDIFELPADDMMRIKILFIIRVRTAAAGGLRVIDEDIFFRTVVLQQILRFRDRIRVIQFDIRIIHRDLRLIVQVLQAHDKGSHFLVGPQFFGKKIFRGKRQFPDLPGDIPFLFRSR